MKRKNEILTLIFFILIQTIIYIIVGINKQYLHIDEAYSYGLAGYDKIDIQENEDFFDNWHEKNYYKDYLTINKDEIGNYKPVYENQKNDVHPPLYYLLLRFAMGFNIDGFSKWVGINLNIIIYGFITVFMYLILKKLFKGEKNLEIKSLLLAFVSSITLASISNVIYARMYSLLALNILITTYFHMKLLETEKVNSKLLIKIGITTILGILTHYYYLFYISITYLVLFIKYIKEKRIKDLLYYTLTIISSGIISIIIFPYILTHIFLGYRGKGVVNRLQNLKEVIVGLFTQIYNIYHYGFNNLLLLISVFIIVLLIYKKIKYNKRSFTDEKTKELLKVIIFPTLFFLIMASISSPWNVLRYIVGVLGLFFVLVIYYLYRLLELYFSEKISNIFVLLILLLTLIMPFIKKMDPELLYRDKKEIVEEINQKSSLPTVYLFNTQKRTSFIDDILLFTKINESYISKDNYDVKEILKDKDISKGILIFINNDEENENKEILDKIKVTLNFNNYDYIGKSVSCNIYYMN